MCYFKYSTFSAILYFFKDKRLLRQQKNDFNVPVSVFMPMPCFSGEFFLSRQTLLQLLYIVITFAILWNSDVSDGIYHKRRKFPMFKMNINKIQLGWWDDGLSNWTAHKVHTFSFYGFQFVELLFSTSSWSEQGTTINALNFLRNVEKISPLFLYIKIVRP